MIEKQKFSLLETLIITICAFFVLGSIILGLIYQHRVNQDKIKIRNLASVSRALEQYYNDSSSSEYSRKYPVSQCSTSNPNSVDFEHTLYLILTGQDKNTNIYIEQKDYPQDTNAKYQEITDNNCNGFLKQFDTSKYSPNNKECVYQPENKKNNCYLYSTSPEGDRFTLSFFSESKGVMAKITKLRANQTNYEKIDINKELIVD
ncbi:MAG: hypothetical protein ACRCXZ_05875 [Patescibacteria group bacterium]